MTGLEAFASSFDDIRVFLLYYWVESCLIAYVGTGLLGIKFNIKNLIKIGLIHGSAVFVIRGLYTYFGFIFGTHTLILLAVMTILLSLFVKIRPGIALASALIGVMVLILGDIVTMPYFYKLMDVPVEQIWANLWTHVLAGYVSDSVLIMTAFIISFGKVSLFNLGSQRY